MTQSGKHAVVDGDAVSRTAGLYRFKGVEHVVLDLDGDDYRLLNREGGATIIEMYDLVPKLVPSLAADVNALSGKQLGQILAIADGRVKEVEAQFPNGSGPTTETSPPA